MAGYRERSPLVSARDSEMPNKQWQKHIGDRQNQTATNAAIRNIQSQLDRMRVRPQQALPSGINFQVPAELDTRFFVGANTLVYISPNNEISSAGLIDLVSGNNETARSGIWLAMLDVPAQVTNPSGKPDGVYYNVPQLPYPGATGTPTSTPSTAPLKGDIDGINVFWVFIAQTPNC